MLAKTLLPFVLAALVANALPIDPVADSPAAMARPLAVDAINQAPVHPPVKRVNPKKTAVGVASIPKNKAQKVVQGRQEPEFHSGFVEFPDPTSTAPEPTSVPEDAEREEPRHVRRVSPFGVPGQVKGKATQTKGKVTGRSPVDPMFVPETVIGVASGAPSMVTGNAPVQPPVSPMKRAGEDKNTTDDSENMPQEQPAEDKPAHAPSVINKLPVQPPVKPPVPGRRAVSDDENMDDKPMQDKPKQNDGPTQVPATVVQMASGSLPVQPPVQPPSPGRRAVSDEKNTDDNEEMPAEEMPAHGNGPTGVPAAAIQALPVQPPVKPPVPGRRQFETPLDEPETQEPEEGGEPDSDEMHY